MRSNEDQTAPNPGRRGLGVLTLLGFEGPGKGCFHGASGKCETWGAETKNENPNPTYSDRIRWIFYLVLSLSSVFVSTARNRSPGVRIPGVHKMKDSSQTKHTENPAKIQPRSMAVSLTNRLSRPKTLSVSPCCFMLVSPAMCGYYQERYPVT